MITSYGFGPHADASALCLGCKEVIETRKSYNLSRHIKAHHKEYLEWTEAARQKEFKELYNKIYHTEGAVVDASKLNKASLTVSLILAKAGMPYSHGTMIKECMVRAANIFDPSSLVTLSLAKTSLGCNRVQRNITDMDEDVVDTLKDRFKQYRYWSVAIDDNRRHHRWRRLCGG